LVEQFPEAFVVRTPSLGILEFNDTTMDVSAESFQAFV